MSGVNDQNQSIEIPSVSTSVSDSDHIDNELPNEGTEQDWEPRCLDKCLGCSHGSPKNDATTGYLLLRIIQGIFVAFAGVIFASILTFQALKLKNCSTSDDDNNGACSDSISNGDDGVLNDDIDTNCNKLWGLIKPDSLLTTIASIAGIFTAITCPFVGTAMDFTPYRKNLGIGSVLMCTLGTILCCALIIPTEFTIAICSFGFFLIYVFKDFLSMASDSYVPELSSVHYEVSAAVSSSLTWIFITEVSYILICVILSGFFAYSVFGTIVSAATTIVVWGLLPFAYERVPHVHASRSIPDDQTLISFSAIRLKDLSMEVYQHYTDIGLLFLANMIFDPALNGIFIAAILILVHYEYSSSEVTLVLFIAIISAIPGSMISKWIVHIGVQDGTDTHEPHEHVVEFENSNSSDGMIEEPKQVDMREGETHICHMKWSLVLGLLSCGLITILAAYTMKKCDLIIPVFYGVLWGFGLSWCWNTSNMLRNALVPGGSEAELSGLSFSTLNIIAWLPPLVFTIANELGNIGDATLSLLGFLVLGAIIVSFMDVPRGLNSRRVTLDKRRWVVPSLMPNGTTGGSTVDFVSNTDVELSLRTDINILLSKMGSWWRSEEMTYVCMVISEVAAPACIRELGVLGCIQFTDLNPEIPPFQRPHISTIKRCDEMERKIRYIHHISTSLDIRIHEAGSISNFLHNVTNSVDNNQGDISSAASILENIESQLNAYEAQLIDLEKYGKQLYVEYNAKVEFQHVLNKAILLYQSEMNSMSMNSPLGGHAHAQKDHLRGSARDHDDVEEHIELNSYHYNDGLARGYENELSFSNLTGILPDSSERVRFERMIFRVTRGNCWLRFVNIDEQEMATENGYRCGNNGMTTMSGVANNTKKCMFIIFYKSKTIHDKLKKVCDGFSARLYSLQSLDNPKDIEKQQVSNAVEVQESLMIFNKNLLARKQICLDVSLVLENWLWVIRREKAIYHILNMCKDDLAAGLLICRGWILTSQIELTRSALNRAHMQANLPPSLILEPVNELWPTPPTHFKTNKYTDGYQEFVNTYGIPRYREINPALFTAATFPFLFGIMYGDIGHGICLMLAGMYLILTEHVSEKRSTGEMVKGIYSARYMLFAMGVCAIYAGSVYNDYFSLGLNLFGSRYAFSEQLKGEEAIPLSTYGDAAAVYPYGIDPAWKIASNTLLFFNSFKMKLSVVLGIAQMTLGICLKGINALYFNQYLDFVCEFIPMLVFDLCFFGYMVVLIFVKWTINWDERMQLGTCGYTEDGIWGECNLQENDSCFTYNGDYCDSTTELLDMCPLGMGGTSNGCQPPNLITTLMNMALSPGIVNEPLYHGQASVQLFLLGVAFLCVPILLFAKPFILKRQHEQSRLSCTQIGNEHELGHTIDHEPHVDVDSPLLSSQSDHDPSMEHEFDFGEVFIHQAIETIEFVLGMVSNTASYLRLWALSLAHTELAEVFWSKALMAAIKTGSPVAIFFGFAIFAAVTFAVLLCMDVLECFLHALRLHWVEFQNKFYKADGYRFQPFDFYPIISKAIID